MSAESEPKIIVKISKAKAKAKPEARALHQPQDQLSVGLIVHWGLYSVTAYDDPSSAARRRTGNGSEWYLARLLETGKYRPISGYKETQAYHHKHYAEGIEDLRASYFALKNDFEDQAKDWDPDIWIKMAKQINANYIILTTRHHDGFCLWPTKTSVNSMKTINLVQRFTDAVRAAGLQVGFYYSWMEFGQNITQKYLDQVIMPQIQELQQYHPDIWWFDGDWTVSTQVAKRRIQDLAKKLTAGGALVNDRIALGKDFQTEEGRNMLGEASYRVYKDRTIPDIRPTVPWEHVNTIGRSWGANLAAATTSYKTGQQLAQLKQQVHYLGGRFLINIGPLPDGSILEPERKSLEELSEITMRKI